MKNTAPIASRVFRTEWGYIGIAATDKGLARVVLPREEPGAVEAKLPSASERARPSADGSSRAEAILDQAREQIVEYLEGRRRVFDVPLDIPNGTAFTRSVWTACGAIPFGQVRSYRELAREVGRADAMRAVGQALGANPLPIVIPCHRVVRSDGALGGFGGGLPLKKRLLELEGHYADVALARRRAAEPRETLESVKRRLRKMGKIAAG
jgi:O-6-methylguanine DNA methyltransferase